jgi:Phosphate transport regulator (distant homolog of PhoU)
MDKRNVFDRLFPVKYDFYGMLNKQAELNMLGIDKLYKWLSSRGEKEKEELFRYVKEADEVRLDMESKLIEAFVTPFDREDIYSISVEMDKVIEFSKSTLESMEAYEVEANDMIINMVKKIKEGTEYLYESLTILESNPIKSQQNITKMRNTHVEVEKLYREGMAYIFKGNDSMHALKLREVYHHIKDASTNLEYTVDIFHRIIVRRV